MKKTRNLFILFGSEDLLHVVMNQLQFKGLEVITEPITSEVVTEIFDNNKSIVCTSKLTTIKEFDLVPIYIEVTNSLPYSNLDIIKVSDGNIPGQFENIAKCHNCDIGDRKSNSSGLNGAPTSKDCCYCKIISGMSESERILYESKNFFVVSTLGEFIKGYLLIIPKAHIMSMAQLSFDLQKEFINVLNDVSYILYITYDVRHTLVWENGTGNSGIGKAKDSIVHAHTHIAPSSLTALDIMETSEFPMKKISLSNLPKYAKHSYLLVRGSNNNEWFINNNSKLYIPRQYVRQILAKEHDVLKRLNILTVDNDKSVVEPEVWNWRTYPFYDLMNETNNDIRNALKQNWEVVPERIKINTRKHLFSKY